jgi:hypothetical protein
MRVFGLCVLLAAICTAGIADAQVKLNKEGFVLVNGKPQLVLGMYALPKDAKPDEDALLQQLADNGFNLMHAGADKAVLDRNFAHGLKSWIPLGTDVMLAEGDTAAREKLFKTVNEYKNHPGLFAWEGPDEKLWFVFGMHRDWFEREVGSSGAKGQPAVLKDLIEKAAAAGKPNAAKCAALLTEAVDYAQRTMWKESEARFAEIWNELGEKNPQPDAIMTKDIEQIPITGEQFARGWKCVREADPNHVIWQNHAPCNSPVHLQMHNKGVDAAGCDIYPAPNYSGVRHSDLVSNMELTAVGAVTDTMRAGAPGKSCWMVLQGFGWTDLGKGSDVKEPTDPVRGRRPDWQETHFMAYNALMHGANAILYWGTFLIEKDSGFWKDILRIGKELRALEPAIVAPEAADKLKVVGEPNYTTYNGGDPKVSLRKVGDDWVLFAVNEWRTGVAFDVQGLPKALEGKKLYRLYTNEEHTVKNGGFHDGIRGHDAHVYSTSRRFEAK